MKHIITFITLSAGILNGFSQNPTDAPTEFQIPDSTLFVAGSVRITDSLYVPVLHISGLLHQNTPDSVLTVINGYVGKSVMSNISTIINVKDHGVKGDSVADDADSIQAVLDTYQGNLIYFPKGYYRIKQKLNLRSGTTMWGSGYQTVLYADPVMDIGDYVPIVEVPPGDSFTILRNIRFVGIRSNTNIFGWHGASHSKSNLLERCWYEHFGCVAGGALDLSNSNDNIIANNTFTDCEVAIFLTGTNKQFGNTIIGNKIYNAKTAGIRAEYPYKTVITGNYIDAKYDGIYIIGSYQEQGSLMISGNTIIVRNSPQNYNAGIRIGFPGSSYELNRSTITGNTISILASPLAYGSGITIYNAKNLTISGNNIYAQWYYGINLNPYPPPSPPGIDSSIFISGNLITGNDFVSSSIVTSPYSYNPSIISNSTEKPVIDSSSTGFLSNTTGAANNLVQNGTINHTGYFNHTGDYNLSGQQIIYFPTTDSTTNALKISVTDSTPGSTRQLGSGLVFFANSIPHQSGPYNSGRIYSAFDGGTYSSARLTFQTPSGGGSWMNTLTLKNGKTYAHGGMYIGSIPTSILSTKVLTDSSGTIKKVSVSPGVLTLDTSHIAFDNQVNTFSVKQNFSDTVKIGTVKLVSNGENNLQISGSVEADKYYLNDGADKNRYQSIYSSGTAYSFTATYDSLTFGTTNPSLTIQKAGTYMLLSTIEAFRNNVSTSAGDTIYYKIRRTNNTASDIDNSETSYIFPQLTNQFGSMEVHQIPPLIYTTSNLNDRLVIYGKIATTPTAGSLDIKRASLTAIRLY